MGRIPLCIGNLDAEREQRAICKQGATWYKVLLIVPMFQPAKLYYCLNCRKFDRQAEIQAQHVELHTRCAEEFMALKTRQAELKAKHIELGIEFVSFKAHFNSL